jgi:ferredoxin-NADP reductase/hemoglobin-like flavoprotein
VVDAPRLKQSFAAVARYGDEVPLYFYSYLFLKYPQVRGMFPPGMAGQRDRLLGALVDIVTNVDNLPTLVPLLEGLGQDHRKFHVQPAHYPAVGDALIATLSHFSGEAWTAEIAADWATAYGIVSDVMIKSAAAAAGPPSWTAEVVGHERRGLDLAVVTVQPTSTYTFRPGQSLAVQIPQRPHRWRFYSPANAPRPDGTLEFHIRAIDGGWVSSALTAVTAVGDLVQLGPAVGALGWHDPGPRSALFLAGGTGLAPLRSMLEGLPRATELPPIRLVHQTRLAGQHYDRVALRELASRMPNLEVVLVADEGPDNRECIVGFTGAEIAIRYGWWQDSDVYICGSDTMTQRTAGTLMEAGLLTQRLHYETFGYRAGPAGAEPATSAPTAASANQQVGM